MNSPINFINDHVFLTGIIIVVVFFIIHYLAVKGYWKKIGFDKKTIKKTFKDIGLPNSNNNVLKGGDEKWLSGLA